MVDVVVVVDVVVDVVVVVGSMVVVVEVVGTVVLVVVVVEVVAVVDVVVEALTMIEPKEKTFGTKYLARVRYPATVRCTPSAIKRLILFGVKAEFQSDTNRLGQRFTARRSSVLKRFARSAKSGRVLSANSRLTQSTGLPLLFDITRSMTHFGYEA